MGVDPCSLAVAAGELTRPCGGCRAGKDPVQRVPSITVSANPPADEQDDADPVGSAGEPVPEAVASDDDVVDELPEDLNLAEFVGPYTFPNNNRRRIPAAMYLVIGLGCIGAWAAWESTSPLVNVGILAAGVALVLFGIYGLIAGVTLRVDEADALVTASAQVGFAVGHASAQQVWHGWLSRPTWRILAYSAENPPRMRGIVLIDGVSGEVMEWFAEENPEDWADLDPSRTSLTGE